MVPYERFSVPVSGGTLAVGRWGNGTPGLSPGAMVATMSQRLGHVVAHFVAGVNHFTIVTGDDGANRVARAILDSL